MCLTDLADVGNANAAWQGHLTQLCIDARLFNDACTSLRIALMYILLMRMCSMMHTHYYTITHCTVHSASHTKLLVTPLLMKLEFKIFSFTLIKGNALAMHQNRTRRPISNH